MLHITVTRCPDVIVAITHADGQSSAASGSNASTLITAAAISALTSAFVALSIEWLAKPRLEARKARILARHSAAQEIRVQLSRILELSVRVSAYPRMTGMLPEQQAALRQAYEGFIERAQAAIDGLDSAILDTKLSTSLYGLMTGYLGFAKGRLGSSETSKEKFYQLAAGTIAVQRAIKAPSWIPKMKKSRIDLAEFTIRNPPRSPDST